MASIVALLDTFDDAASLSRAAALADDMQRQRAVLQDELAAVERALPAALAAVQSNTRSAIEQLDRLAGERSALEDSIAQQMGVSQQLLAKLEPPLTKLSQLDEARLVLRVLVTADELVRAAQPAGPSQGGSDSHAAGMTAGATDGGLHSLLRLQALRACVANEEAAEEAAVEGGSNEWGSSAAAEQPRTGTGTGTSTGTGTGRGAGAQLTRALLRLLDQRAARLVDAMRAPLAARAAAALRELGWPGEVAGGQAEAAAQEAAVQAVQAAFTELLLLQYCAQPYAASQEEEEEAQSRGSGLAPLWAVEAMVLPVLRRFRYHFEGRRETNRRDKPEWVFSHCTGLLRLHRSLLAETVQPMLLAPLAALEAAFTSARLKEAERHRYVRMVALRCPHGVYVSLAGALCDAMAAKLTREMASLLRTPALFSHTLNECLGVEEELRYAHGIPAAAGSVLRAVYSAPAPLQRWLELERDDGAAALERLLQEAQWVAPRAALLQLAPGEGGGAPQPPPCAAGLLTLLGGVQRRMALVADPATQLALLQRVMLPLLGAFTERLRSRLNQQSLAAQMAAPAETDWPQLGGMLLATAHCASRLEEWSDSEPLAALLPREVPQTESAEPGASAGGAFGTTLLEWAEIEREIEQLAHEIITSSFGTAARKYISDRRAFRFVTAQAATSLDITAAFCAPLGGLRADLSAVLAALPPRSCRRVALAVGSSLDQLLWAGMLRTAPCSEAGGVQLAHDMRALVGLFAPFSSRPHTLLRHVHEACQLLVLPRPERTALLAEIGELATLGAEHAPAALAALQTKLEALQVFRLGPAEVKDVLSNLQVDD